MTTPGEPVPGEHPQPNTPGTGSTPQSTPDWVWADPATTAATPPTYVSPVPDPAATAPTVESPRLFDAPPAFEASGPPAYGTTPPMPPLPPTVPSHWPTPPSGPSTSPVGKRIAAVVAVLALVLASAGIGAAIASRFKSNPTSFNATAPNTNNGSGTNNGNGNNNPSGSGNNNPFGSGNSSPGSSASGNSGSANIDGQAIAAKVDPAIVNITTTINNGQGEAAGTGMVITSDGEVLTNNHVIANATDIKVEIGGNGSSHAAHVIGYDVADDVGLIKIDNAQNLATVKIGDSSKVQSGDPIVAIGNALGKGGTPSVATGEVAALDQSVTASDGEGSAETLHGMIQISAPIQPGDSGGPLVNSNSEVIGMNTAASVGGYQTQARSTVAFSIPIAKAMTIVHQIEQGDESGNVHIGVKGILGVELQRNNSSSNTGGGFFSGGGSGSNSSSTGAVVSGVQPNGPAANAGIQSGDTITSVYGRNVDTANALGDALQNSHPNDKVKVGWTDSSGQQHTATVRLAAGPPA